MKYTEAKLEEAVIELLEKQEKSIPWKNRLTFQRIIININNYEIKPPFFSV